MELYSKEELLKELKKEYSCGGECDHCPEVLDAGSCSVLRCIRRIIDNVTPVEANVQDLINEYNKGFNNGYKSGKNERPQGEITNEDIQQAIKEGFANGYEMAKAKFERPQGDLADEVWKLYEKHQSHLATRVLEFGDELKELLGKYQKGGAEDEL